MTNTATQKPLGGQMSLMEHLIELRSRLIKSFVAIAIGSLVGWFLYQPVFAALKEPLEKLASEHENVSGATVSLAPLDQFMLRIKVSAYLGIGISMPFLLWQLWAFIAPGLYQNERRYARAFVGSASVLFLLGAAIAYLTLFPALEFLQSVGGDDVVYQYTTENYLMLVVYMMLAFGVGFQFPIVLVFLQLVGVVRPDQLASWRRFAIVVIFVVAAIITPSADPISLIALALPMVLFYEISILIGRVVRRRRLHNEASA